MNAAVRTTLIVTAAVALTATAGIGLTKRLVRMAAPAGGGIAELHSGKDLTLKFSDRPTAIPAMSLTDLEGHPLSNADFKGKVVLLNFWATWCGPCREEIPTLVELQQHYASKLLIVGLSIDTGSPESVKTFADQFSVNYPVAIASEDLEQAFGGVTAVPSTFVVNPEGRIVMRHMGMLDPALTEHEIRSLSGLPTEAKVETIKDTGQVLLSNAAYATEIPGVDLSHLTPVQKEQALARMNQEHCTCGCGLTLAQCRINDDACQFSLPAAQKVAKEASEGKLPTAEAKVPTPVKKPQG